jgi:protein-tyrosine phosphatase
MDSSLLLTYLNKKKCSWASEILPGLFLGSGSDAENINMLTKNCIEYILNVSDDVPNFHEDNSSAFKYLKLNVADFGQDSGISRVFRVAFEFLEDVKFRRKAVLVHCAAGANRSATVIIAWLMYSYNWTLSHAFSYVKSKRNSICPMKDNRIQLLEYEILLHNGVSSFENDEEFIYG